MDTTHFTPASSTQASDWVCQGIVGFAESVLSIVPVVFAAYARIFHPPKTSDRTSVRWAQVAERTGRVFHPAVQWPSLVGSTDYNFRIADTWDSPPELGSLPVRLAVSLVEILQKHTSTPGHCWFGIWNGFAGTVSSVQSAPQFELPNRRYHLMEGPIDCLTETATDFRRQSVNLCWPNDRTWFVATEIDFVSTYVGATRDGIDSLLPYKGLEAVQVSPDDGVAWADDKLNPPPTDHQWWTGYTEPNT